MDVLASFGDIKACRLSVSPTAVSQFLMPMFNFKQRLTYFCVVDINLAYKDTTLSVHMYLRLE